MSALSSSVLVLSSERPARIHVEVDWASDVLAAKKNLNKNKYDVLATDISFIQDKNFEKLYGLLLESNPSLQMILVSSAGTQVADLMAAFNLYPIFRFALSVKSEDFEKELVFALEEAQLKKQDLQLENLVRDQNEKLRSLYEDLEDRVDKRQKFLLEARKKTFLANARWESLREATLAIHQSFSVGEMEGNLLKALQRTLELKMIRILLKPQDESFLSFHRQQAAIHIAQVPLFRYQESLGSLFFFRSNERPFSREETEFLGRIAEAVSFAMDRLQKLEQSETLKDQWQATFNSISDPVSLINQNYEIVQTNEAYLLKSSLSSEQVIGQKCHQILFQRTSPCPNCQVGKNFRLETMKPKGLTFDVYSQRIQVEPLSTDVFVNLYHDVTNQIRMERKILDSARLAELGTIGSSIAHELNNPLGGILSFVQLIKMDLKPEDPMYDDIVSMEDGVRRCRDIIQNLLGFTRDPSSDEESVVDLKTVIERATKIVELQTKSRGIEVKFNFPKEACTMMGHFNLLSQAVRNLLQISIESLIDKSRSLKGFQGLIEINLEARPHEYLISLLDNGLGSEPTSGLSLSVAGQIIHDSGGTLEISSQSKPFRLAKISFPRPVFQA